MRFTTLLLFTPFLLFADQEPEGRQPFIEASLAYHHGAFDDCVDGYRKVISLHFEVPFSKMMIGRCLALKGGVDDALDALDEAAEFEFLGVQVLRTDPDFASIRDNPRFADIVAKTQSNSVEPCKLRSRRHQMDFWIGEWTVTNPAGKLIGTEKIEAVEEGCAIRELFSGNPAGSGQSLTFYDRLTGYWRQVWMDPSGQRQDFYGELTDLSMGFVQITYSGGLKTILTASLAPLPDGTVRQTAQRSTDDGATWIPVSNYLFTRKVE